MWLWWLLCGIATRKSDPPEFYALKMKMEIPCSESAHSVLKSSKFFAPKYEFCAQKMHSLHAKTALNRPPRILHSENGNFLLKKWKFHAQNGNSVLRKMKNFPNAMKGFSAISHSTPHQAIPCNSMLPCSN